MLSASGIWKAATRLVVIQSCMSPGDLRFLPMASGSPWGTLNAIPILCRSSRLITVRSRLPGGYFLELKLHAFELPAAHREFFEDLGNKMQQAAFSPDGRWLAAAGKKGLGLWSLTTTDPGRVIEAPPMARLDFTSDG